MLDEILHACEARGVCRFPDPPTYYLGRERLLPIGRTRMARWRKRFFIVLHHNAPSMQDFFSLPVHQVLEVGMPIEL